MVVGPSIAWLHIDISNQLSRRNIGLIFRHLPKLIDRLIRPTGSNANQESTMTWLAEEPPAPPWPCPAAPVGPAGPGFWGDPRGAEGSGRAVEPPCSILSADTQPDALNSVSIFLRRISSAISDIRTQSIPIGVGRSPDLSYTVNSISLAFSMSMLKASSCHRSDRVALVLALMASSTLRTTNVSGPRENLELAA